MRRRIVWLLSIPLILAGSQLAHDLAYWIAYPSSGTRSQVLAATGHGYLRDALFGFVLGIAVVLAALLFRIVEVRRDRAATALRVPLAPFVALPPAIFVLQEHLERLLHDGVFPYSTVIQPSFGPGLFLQFVLALAMYVLARLLLRVAEQVGRALGDERPKRRAAIDVRGLRPITIDLAPVAGVLATGYAGRAPPHSRAS